MSLLSGTASFVTGALIGFALPSAILEGDTYLALLAGAVAIMQFRLAGLLDWKRAHDA